MQIHGTGPGTMDPDNWKELKDTMHTRWELPTSLLQLTFLLLVEE